VCRLMRWCVPDGVFWTPEDCYRVILENLAAIGWSLDQLAQGLHEHAKRIRYVQWRLSLTRESLR
jgi:hypothetical protein